MTKKAHIQTAIVIDDSEADRIILSRFIEISKFANEVVTFSCPFQALEALISGMYNPSTTMIFLDVHMPIMDGFEFLDKFNATGINAQNFKVVFHSGSENMADRDHALKFPNVVRFHTKSSNFDWLDRLSSKGCESQPELRNYA